MSILPPIANTRKDAVTGGVLDQVITLDMAVLACSPLGGGRLFDPTTPSEHAAAEALKQVAATQSISVSAAAFSWIMAHP